jgi:hypothetical protein
MSALMGVPQSLSEHDVTAQLPEFAAHTSKSLALGIHVKLARATSSILQSEFSITHRSTSKRLADNTTQPSMAEMGENPANSCKASRTP